MTGTTGKSVAVPHGGHAVSRPRARASARARVRRLWHPQPRAGRAAARSRRRRHRSAPRWWKCWSAARTRRAGWRPARTMTTRDEPARHRQSFPRPEGSANGGYFAGCVAARAAHTVTVRLLRPPPPRCPARDRGAGRRHAGRDVGTERVGEAKPATCTLDIHERAELSRGRGGLAPLRRPQVPPLPDLFRVRYAAAARRRNESLRRPLAARDLVAAPWIPDGSLDRGDGKVRAGVHVRGARLSGLLRGEPRRPHDASRRADRARQSPGACR